MPIQYGYNSPVIQPTYGYQMMQAPVAMAPQPITGRNNYMIQVDGEMAAKAWQAPAPMGYGPYRDYSQSGYDPRYWR